MTKKCFWAHVLPAMLLVAMPMFANAQNPNVGNLTPPNVIVTDGAGTHGAGVVIQPTGADTATVDYDNGTPQQLNVNGAGELITIGKVTLPATPATYGTVSTSAVAVFGATGSLDKTTITVGDINFAGSSNTALFGFSYAVGDGANTSTPFGGILNLSNVDVKNLDVNAGARAVGVSFTDDLGTVSADITGKVKVGDITVTSNGQGNSSGFAAGALAAGGSVELGDVKVVAKNTATTPTGGAGGVYLSGDIGDSNVVAPNGQESFTVKDITVEASTNGLVSGLRGANIGTDGTLKVGDVKVTNASALEFLKNGMMNVPRL
jgi:hypothetical protein